MNAVTDPTMLYRLRDGVYAPDLLIAAVAELDLFSWLAAEADAGRSGDPDTICREFGLAARPVDVLLTYLTALGLLERTADGVVPTQPARDHLVAGSPYDPGPYYASLQERPGCAELLQVLRSDQPAAWASADGGSADTGPREGAVGGPDWAGRLDDPAFAERITAAMDARGRFLGPRLAGAVAEVLADVLADRPVRRVLDVGRGGRRSRRAWDR